MLDSGMFDEFFLTVFYIFIGFLVVVLLTIGVVYSLIFSAFFKDRKKNWKKKRIIILTIFTFALFCIGLYTYYHLSDGLTYRNKARFEEKMEESFKLKSLSLTQEGDLKTLIDVPRSGFYSVVVYAIGVNPEDIEDGYIAEVPDIFRYDPNPDPLESPEPQVYLEEGFYWELNKGSNEMIFKPFDTFDSVSYESLDLVVTINPHDGKARLLYPPSPDQRAELYYVEGIVFISPNIEPVETCRVLTGGQYHCVVSEKMHVAL